MEVFRNIPEIVEYLNECRREGDTIGFVPTMGALHDGHIALVRKSAEDNSRNVVSIFINPAQFGAGEDFESYPRNIEADLELLQRENVDAVFIPETEEIYPKDFKTLVDVGGLSNNLCGISRPSHFRGVTTIVTKLFNIIRPDRAYFGQKDAQQAIIIKKLVRDINFQIEIVVIPTVRDEDGLALSSRNQHLSPAERIQALSLHRALQKAELMVGEGERDAMRIVEQMAIIIEDAKGQIDYVAIVDGNTLEDVAVVNGNILMAVAVFFGETRLIDNMMFYDVK